MVIEFDEVTPLTGEVSNVAKDLYSLGLGPGVLTTFSGASTVDGDSMFEETE